MSDDRSMIERVARAICAASGDYWREPPLYLAGSDNLNNHWYHKARAAIEAMREPTTPMSEAATAFLAQSPDGWTVMIDAALAERPETA